MIWIKRPCAGNPSSNCHRFGFSGNGFALGAQNRLPGIGSWGTLELRGEYYLPNAIFHVDSSLLESVSAKIAGGVEMPTRSVVN